MKSIFEWTLRDGRKARLEGTYVREMKAEIIDMDGLEIEGDNKPYEPYENELILYVDGKKLRECRNRETWALGSIKNGTRIMWGLPVGFEGENIEKYETWLAALIDGGTTDEVKAYDAEKSKAARATMIEEAKKTIHDCDDLGYGPFSIEECRTRRRNYINLYNEGHADGGYVPYYYNHEQYDAAKKILEDCGE